ERKIKGRTMPAANDYRRSKQQRRARPVRRRRDQWKISAGLSERKQCRSEVDDGHLCGASSEHRQLALVGRADLHARRKTTTEVGDVDFRPFQKSAVRFVQQR